MTNSLDDLLNQIYKEIDDEINYFLTMVDDILILGPIAIKADITESWNAGSSDFPIGNIEFTITGAAIYKSNSIYVDSFWEDCNMRLQNRYDDYFYDSNKAVIYNLGFDLNL